MPGIIRRGDYVAANCDPRHVGEVYGIDHQRGEYSIAWVDTGWHSTLPMGTVHVVQHAGPYRALLATDLLP